MIRADAARHTLSTVHDSLPAAQAWLHGQALGCCAPLRFVTVERTRWHQALLPIPCRYEGIISLLCENLDTLDEPEAKAAMVWVLGEPPGAF